jgi:hypothetical protein
MTIFIWSLSTLAVVTLLTCAAIPIARAIKNRGRLHDVAEEMYPGDPAGQANFRDKIASQILRADRDLKYESPEFQDRYQQEMKRLLEEYRS